MEKAVIQTSEATKGPLPAISISVLFHHESTAGSTWNRPARQAVVFPGVAWAQAHVVANRGEKHCGVDDLVRLHLHLFSLLGSTTHSSAFRARALQLHARRLERGIQSYLHILRGCVPDLRWTGE